MLLQFRLQELNADVMLAADDADALKARAEYNSLVYFAEWITQLGEDRNGR